MSLPYCWWFLPSLISSASNGLSACEVWRCCVATFVAVCCRSFGAAVVSHEAGPFLWRWQAQDVGGWSPGQGGDSCASILRWRPGPCGGQPSWNNSEIRHETQLICKVFAALTGFCRPSSVTQLCGSLWVLQTRVVSMTCCSQFWGHWGPRSGTIRWRSW